jgi:hypothetical protein
MNAIDACEIAKGDQLEHRNSPKIVPEVSLVDRTLWLTRLTFRDDLLLTRWMPNEPQKVRISLNKGN